MGSTSLNQRYVREWLGAMVTSGVVEVDPSVPEPSGCRQ
jgi:hypothetical protein